jgi:hypothetical protein
MTPTELQEAAMKLQRETTGHVRDVESNIFARPSLVSFGVNFDGDTPNYAPDPTVQKNRTRRVRLRREFNNMSLTKKKSVRELCKSLAKAVKYLAAKDPA